MIINRSIRQQIIKFVESAPIESKEKIGNNGELLGYQIRSLVDSELFYVAHPVREIGEGVLRKIFVEKLEKDFLAGKLLPFKLKA